MEFTWHNFDLICSHSPRLQHYQLNPSKLASGQTSKTHLFPTDATNTIAASNRDSAIPSTAPMGQQQNNNEAVFGVALYDSKPWLRDLDVLSVQIHPWLLHFVDKDSDDWKVAELERWYQHGGIFCP